MTLTWCCVVNGNWYGAVKCSAMLYGNWYGMVWCCVTLYGIVQCSMPWQGLFQFDTCIRPNKSLWNDVSTWLSLKDPLQDILQTDSYGQRPLIESQIKNAPIQATFVQSRPTCSQLIKKYLSLKAEADIYIDTLEQQLVLAFRFVKNVDF